MYVKVLNESMEILLSVSSSKEMGERTRKRNKSRKSRERPNLLPLILTFLESDLLLNEVCGSSLGLTLSALLFARRSD